LDGAASLDELACVYGYSIEGVRVAGCASEGFLVLVPLTSALAGGDMRASEPSDSASWLALRYISGVYDTQLACAPAGGGIDKDVSVA
jgi:hypothetical protein